jgi:predicted ATPase
MNDVIRKFGIAEEIDLVKEQKLPVLALKVKTKEFWSNITDVGYGVSLQIPILFQAILSEFFTEYGNTILIEQPEVHLHPSLQSKFIDTLLSLGEKNNYFIETHSEHIIRMLQVIVKAKRYGITNEDISIHYFRRTKEQFLITQHRLMPDGKLEEPFPSGFYDASYSLVKELL